jgi:Acyl-CoA thioesterase C-terminal domain/Acyl-CoA thioesterase N-terminal domain
MSNYYYKLVDGRDRLGERLIATELTASTWSPSIQHGGPPSALLVRALERCRPRPDMRLSRVVIDLLGAIPVGTDLWVTAHVERPGKRIELVGAQIVARAPNGTMRPVAKASGWRMQYSDTQAVVSSSAGPLRLPTDEDRKLTFDFPGTNYLHSLDWRWLTTFLCDGPGEAWIRPVVDLVEGETMTPLQRLFATADDVNGVGAKLNVTEWTFVNTDVVVHLHRLPEGEWTGVRAQTSYGPDGVGVSNGTLYDCHGHVGIAAQSILLRRTLPAH